MTYLVLSWETYTFLIHLPKEICILIYKAEEFNNDCVKVTSLSVIIVLMIYGQECSDLCYSYHDISFFLPRRLSWPTREKPCDFASMGAKCKKSDKGTNNIIHVESKQLFMSFPKFHHSARLKILKHKSKCMRIRRRE